MKATKGTQLRLLLWKNFLIQKRRPIGSLAEIFVPALLFLLLWALRDVIETNTQPDTVFCSRSVSGLDYPRFYNEPQYGSIPQSDDSFACAPERPFPYSVFGVPSGLSSFAPPSGDTYPNIFYAPNNISEVDSIMARFQTYLTTFFGFDFVNGPQNITGFATTDGLLSAYDSRTSGDVGLAIIFHEDNNGARGDVGFTPGRVHYVMRMPEGLPANDFEGWATGRYFPEFEGLGPDVRATYFEDSYFLTMQHTLDAAIVGVASNITVPPIVPRAAPLPWPAYSDDGFIYAIRNTLPFILVISFLFSVVSLVRHMVHEKEHRLKEAMAMMGVSDIVHWIAWFLRAFVMLFISIILMILIFEGGNFTQYSETGVVFVFLLLFALSTICLCFLISTFFSKASTAATAAGLLFFLAFCPNYYIEPNFESVTASEKAGFCLLSPTCVGIGAYILSLFESSGEGLSFSNLQEGSTEKDSFSMADVFGMLILDCVLYLVLTWYISNVRPGEYGVPRPLYFFALPSYWCGTKAEASYARTNKNDDPNLFEQLPANTPVGVHVENLCKVFKAETGGKKVALDGLTLDVPENQITALLGHNGAGKTTAMSILVGLFPPTSGTATINGHDITRDMDGARASLGLCPQFDVLFDSLTFAEHMIFFSRLKGLTVEEAKREIDTYAQDLDLEEKVHDPVKTLSGGQKRAVSVSIALCGGSKVVFLDEPTSGMDPYKRRHTWDLLLKHRKGRTMLLTTHFMEEADLLGDRIAIMSAGKLRTMGSSLFLKSKFGVGYHMNVVKKPSCNVAGVVSAIADHVPDSELVSDVGSELTFILPREQASNFPTMFDSLDAARKSLGFESYNVSVTTLEEVFLKVAEGNLRPLTASEEQAKTGDVEHVVLMDKHREEEEDRGAADKGVDPGTPLTGVQLLWSQFRAMVTKRILYTSRNKWAILTQLVIPLLFAIAALAIARVGESQPDSPLLPLTFTGYPNPVNVFAAPGDTAGDYRSFLNGTGADIVSSMGNRSTPLQASLFQHLTDHLGSLSGVTQEVAGSPLNQSRSLLQMRGLINYQQTAFYESNVASFTLEAGAYYVGYNSTSNQCGLLRPDLSIDASGVDLAPGSAYTFAVLDPTQAGFTFSSNSSGSPVFDPQEVEEMILVGSIFLPAVSFQLTQQFIGDFAGQDGMLYLFCGNTSASPAPLPINVTAAQASVSDFVNAYVGFSPRALHSPAQGINAIANMMAREYISPDASIHAYNQPLPESATEAVNSIFSDPIGVNLAIFLVFATGFLMASYVLFVLVERVNKAKHVQFVSGVNTHIFWAASFLWEWSTMLVPAIGLIIIVAAFNVDAFQGHLGVIFGLFIMFTFSAIPLVYCISFIYSTPSGAYAAMSIFFVFIGLGGLIGVFVATVLEEYSIADHIRYFFLIIPNYAFGQGLYDVWLNSKFGELVDRFADVCEQEADDNADLRRLCNSHKSNYVAWEEPGVGKPFLYLFLTGVFWYTVLTLIELGVLRRPIVTPPSLGDREEDRDVRAERQRVESGGADNDVIAFRDLSKAFRKKRGQRFTAVDKLTLGVPKGECFGLLGVNGAGKTTTFRMLTGETRPSSGVIHITGVDLAANMAKARQNLGYCPQFDGLVGLLTGREHLIMYARLRGVEESKIARVVEDLVSRLGLTQYADKPAHTYSGGNKRKLSTAVALVGNPAIVMLDEPTTGMDPQARRFLWSVLAQVTARGQSIILTSHSMEECEALCQRLAIMVNGRFKCIGSVGHLKHRFGRGFALHARVKADEDGTAGDTTELKQFVEANFAGAELKEEYNGAITYHIEEERRSWSYMFRQLEEAKSRFSLDDYSLSQVSLERVFLHFAAEQHDGTAERNGLSSDSQSYSRSRAPGQSQSQSQGQAMHSLTQPLREDDQRRVPNGDATTVVV